MKKTTTTLLASALLLGAASVSAQTPTPPRVPFGTGELPEFLKPYDLDGNGKLSVEERQAFEKACREARPNRPGVKNPWDTDGDGVLSDAEKQAAREAIEAKMTEMRTKRFNELDKDGNGSLTNDELALIPGITPEMVTRMIGHLDTDKDGKVSLAEFTAVLRPVAPPIPPMPFPGVRVGTGPLAVHDTDKNGFLSLAEFGELVKVIDTNKDGRISFDEWKAYVLAQPEILPPPPVGDGGGPGPGGRW